MCCQLNSNSGRNKNYHSLKMWMLFCACLLFINGQAIADQLSDAKKAFESGHYSEAVKFFTPLAQQGNAYAQFKLAVLYRKGQGIQQDYKEALKWNRLAAEQGYAKAQNNLGVMYGRGDGVTQDYKEAVKWYRLAAEQGYDIAQNNLGKMYDDGLGVQRDINEAIKWYKKAAEQGHREAQSNLEYLDTDENILSPDDAESV
jgi:TPR repeat protein